jgi:hypothetical protein
VVSDTQYEYRLEDRYERIDRQGVSHGWTAWSDASGYNNKNGGTYTTMSGVKAQITRSKRTYGKWHWPCEFRVFRRAVNPNPWKLIDHDEVTQPSNKVGSVAATRILDVLDSRQGFDHWWDDMEKEFQDEILEAIADVDCE